jgi:hypothetical protein
MSNLKATKDDAQQICQSDSVDALFVEIAGVLCKIIGCAASIREIAHSLPTTPPEHDDVFCPELVLPEVAAGVINHGNNAFTLIERLQDCIRETMQGRATS